VGGPFLYKILIYPVKSLPPVEVLESRITEYGTLEYDRLYAIVDERGRFVNGKREWRVHLIRARYDLRDGRIYLSKCGDRGEEVYRLGDEDEDISRWLSNLFGYRVRLVRSDEGYPDDTRFNGPTVISTGTLAEIASWFPGWDVLQARLRFRANLEIGGVEPFWEDNLYAGPGRPVEFRIGDVVFEGWNISKRCVVPSRDPCTGVPTIGFQKVFIKRRKPMLRGKYPDTDHGYRLAINTRIKGGQAGKVLRIGDPVAIL